MKRWFVWLAIGMFLVASEAQARRMGGGSSFGKQSSRVTQMQKAPATPTQAAGTAAAKPGAATAATPARKPWGGMLGGLAAGLGLAWLASSLGFGAEMGQFLMLLLFGFGLLMLVGWFKRSRQAAMAPANAYAYQGGSDPSGLPAAYRPENVGNDASARPWERTNTSFDGSAGVSPANTGSLIGSSLGGTQSWGAPADFDTPAFLEAAKANFVGLQAAWDQADIGALRAMMTDAMLKEIQSQLADREAHTGGHVNQTEVVMIEARLLGIEDLGENYLASVEFSGMIREEASGAPSPFREVWNMSKSKLGQNGWLVAGVQALQ